MNSIQSGRGWPSVSGKAGRAAAAVADMRFLRGAGKRNIVVPAKAGPQCLSSGTTKSLGPRLRGDDGVIASYPLVRAESNDNDAAPRRKRYAPISVRTSISSGKNVSSSAFLRNATPGEPPV